MQHHETPADKTLHRLIRRIKRHCWRAWAGYALNERIRGDAVVKFYDGRAIHVLPDGSMRWI